MFFGWFRRIEEKIDNMSVTLVQLDAGIAAQNVLVNQFMSDVNAFIAKVTAGQDFTNELNAVQSTASALQAADGAVQAQLNPPASPPAA